MAHHASTKNYLWLLGIIPLGLAAYFFTLIPGIAAGEPVLWGIEWVPALDVGLSFHVDGLAVLMSLLVLGVGGFILIYASGYMNGDPQINRFFFILSFFMAAMLGVVTADNIILLFVFWELTSISSFLLIGFKHDKEKSQKSALQALLVTGAGGLALLGGLVLLGLAGGSWELSTLLTQGDVIRESSLYTPILILVLLGAFTKSAQFPFHFWLPNAMAAPTPVSAYLHSATMVKAGVYLLARLHPLLGDTPAWFWTLIIFGGITGLLGGWLSWQQVDMKRIMAYTTISALGILVFLLGLGDKIGVEAALVFLLVHSLYKGALFMTAGAVDHETGTRDITILGGLSRKMKFTFAATVLATFSMAGIPPLLGFVGKELIYEATVEYENYVVLLTVIAFGMNLFNVASAAIIFYEPYIRPQPADSPVKNVHEAPWTMWLGPLVLGLTAVASFIFVGSEFFSKQLIQAATVAVYGKPVEVSLYAIPPYFTIVPALSILTVIAGVGVWWVHRRWRPTVVKIDQNISRYGPEMGYFNGLDGLLNLAKQLTLQLQNGQLRRYIMYVVLTLLLLVGWPLITGLGSLPIETTIAPRAYEMVIAAVIVTAAFLVTQFDSRLAAVAALGVVGYGIALLYLYFNAPDLAMTQFSIETLTVILYVLVLYRLPHFNAMTSSGGRIRDAFIAGTVGLLMAGLVMYVTTVPLSTHITEYYAQESYKLARGKNIVNVILVDYRGIDTLIEISVLGVAALGVYALIRRAQDLKNTAEAGPTLSTEGDTHD